MGSPPDFFGPSNQRAQRAADHPLGKLAAFLVGHHVAPVMNCACPGARKPQLAHRFDLSASASTWNSDLTGVATAPPALTMSAGVSASICTAPTLVTSNSAVLPNPLTKEAISTTATVPAASAVDARMS